MFFKGFFRDLKSILYCILEENLGGKFYNVKFPLDRHSSHSQRRSYYVGFHFLPSGFHWDYKDNCREYNGISKIISGDA